MTIETLFLIMVPTYLVLVAYGQVGSRKRGLALRTRALTAALRVVLPPAAIFLALLSTGEPRLVASWGMVTLAMLVAGVIVAGLVEWIAPRIG